MGRIVNDEALNTLFRAARTPTAWLPRPVGDTLLRALWELVKLGPRRGPEPPASVLFVKSDAAKTRLAAAIPEASRVEIMGVPAIAIVGSTVDRDRRWVAPGEGGLRAAWLILAARALGLDCRPLWEFDEQAIDAEFFPDGRIAAECLCAIGYGDEGPLSAHEPPPTANEACRIL